MHKAVCEENQQDLVLLPMSMTLQMPSLHFFHIENKIQIGLGTNFREV
jgi:hypothetical protein